MMEIKLSGRSGEGQSALVDGEDYERISRHRWYILRPQRSLTAYARTTVNGKTIFMHQMVTGYSGHDEHNHIDGNGLNNTRANLEIVSHRANIKNGVRQRAWDRWIEEYRNKESMGFVKTPVNQSVEGGGE